MRALVTGALQATAADLDRRSGSHQRSSLRQHLSFRYAGPYVHTKYRCSIGGNNACCNHLHRTCDAFFCWLEQETDILGQFLCFQFFRCRQQHGHMGIVAAGMHDSGISGGIRNTRFLRYRKGIHIRTEHHPRRRHIRKQVRIDTGFTHPHRGIAHLTQSFGQKLCRMILLLR